MKKYLFIFLILFNIPLIVNASNEIYKIDIDVNLNRDGSAYVTEVWDVDGDDGTEWYKVINNLGNMELSDFRVSMDGRILKYKEWNANESLSQKRGYYGINYIGNGLELCFGKYNYNYHRFVLNYKLSNFVFNTDDSQVIYFNFIDRLSSVDFDRFSVTISSYYDFPDTLDVWGYGYDGYAYVSNGKIEMSNIVNSNMNGRYVVLLARFPLNTFNTTNSYNQFTNFNAVYKTAKKTDYSFFVPIVLLLFIVVIFVILFVALLKCGRFISGYAYENDKKIRKSDVSMYKDIPCNGDIYYAIALMNLNAFGYSNTDCFGVMLLKWYYEKKIDIKHKKNNVFNKLTSVMLFSSDAKFDNLLEEKMFNILKKISSSELTIGQFERWSIRNYENLLDVFDEIGENSIQLLKDKGYIYPNDNDKKIRAKNIMNDTIYNDSMKLYGFKCYLNSMLSSFNPDSIDFRYIDRYLLFISLFDISYVFLAHSNDKIKKCISYDKIEFIRCILDSFLAIISKSKDMISQNDNFSEVDF